MRDLDELDRLHAAATPGLWDVARTWAGHNIVGDGWVVAQAEARGARVTEDDSHAIAALHNAWPEISRELRALRAIVGEVES